MGVFQKIGNALARLMYGRNGVDQLSLAIVVGSLVLDLVSMFVAPHHLWLGNALYLVSIAAWAFALFRIFSRNLTKRRSENQRWVNWMWRMKSSRQNAKARHADKAHKYFTCKNCKTICRVPVGKGKIVITCPKCGQDSDRKSVAQNLSVCPKCGYHFPIGAYYRLSTILDPGSFRELFEKLPAADPLSFPGYRAKVEAAQRKTGLTEAVVTATGTIGGRKCVVGVLDSRFFMGSMSAAVGEKITLAIEYATKNRLPLILFAASGGARMQEGILSLMQMAKTSAALARFSEKGLLYISVFTDPTTGGVTASFASLGDIILAEPGALIGFAGPRVIQQTIGETLPEGFQRAEFQEEHGFVDAVVPRLQMRDTLSQLLRLHEKGGRT